MPETSEELRNAFIEALGAPQKSEVDLLPELDTTPVEQLSLGEPILQPRPQAAEPSPTIDREQLSADELASVRSMINDYREAGAAQAFLAKHGPQGDGSYYPCPESWRVMQEFLARKGWQVNAVSLEAAHQAILKGDLPENWGLDEAQVEARARQQRQAKEPLSTGISEGSTSRGPALRAQADEAAAIAEKIQSLPFEEARLVMAQTMARARQREAERQSLV